MAIVKNYGTQNSKIAEIWSKIILNKAESHTWLPKFSGHASWNIPVPDIVVEDPLYICINDVPNPSACDPLCQRTCDECNYSDPHMEGELFGTHPASCYCPEILDSMVGEAVEAEEERKIKFRRYGGLDDQAKESLNNHFTDALTYGVSAWSTNNPNTGDADDERTVELCTE